MRGFLMAIFFSFIRVSYADDLEKDPTTAVMISMGTSIAGGLTLTAVGAGMHSTPLVYAGGLAFVIGPSTGRWYAGDGGILSLGLRTAGTLMLIGGINYTINSADEDCLGFTDAECASAMAKQRRDDGIAAGALLLGAGLVVTTTIWDFIQADHAARRWNTEHVQLAPMTAQHTMGLSLVGQF